MDNWYSECIEVCSVEQLQHDHSSITLIESTTLPAAIAVVQVIDEDG